MDDLEKKKESLENTIKNASNALKSQFDDYKGKGKDIMVIGGIIVAAYAFYKIFDDEDNTSEKEFKPKESSFLNSAFSGMITSVLLSLAKNKILELIQHLNQQENDTKEDN